MTSNFRDFFYSLKAVQMHRLFAFYRSSKIFSLGM